jgi:hypothetical protein
VLLISHRRRRLDDSAGHRLEPHTKTSSGHDDGVDAGEFSGCRADGFIDTGIDDLQIAGKVQPRCNRHIVIHLDRVLALQPEIELLAQKRKKTVAELGPGEPDAKAVIATPRHYPLAADAGEKGILDRVGVSIGSPNPEEDTNSMFRIRFFAGLGSTTSGSVAAGFG